MGGACLNCETICDNHRYMVDCTFEEFLDLVVWCETFPMVETFEEFQKYDDKANREVNELRELFKDVNTTCLECE